MKSPTRLKRKVVALDTIYPRSFFSFWNQLIFLSVIAVLAATSLVYQSQFPNGHVKFISQDPQIDDQYLLDAPTLKSMPNIDLNNNSVQKKEDRKSYNFL